MAGRAGSLGRAAALSALLLWSACRRGPEPLDQVIVARVGDEVITAEEFQLNYEFGYGHLRSGPNPRRDILDYMIREKLLAQEARKMHLDTLTVIRHAMQTLREELLIERVFEEHVLNHIEVTEEEIREEINRGAVSFRFRFLPAATEDEAWETYRAVLEQGWERVFEEKRRVSDEVRRSEPEMTSPLLKADDIDPEILAIIQDLEILTPSQPVLYGDRWYLFQVIDIRRTPVGEYDYENKSESARKEIYNRKAMQGGNAFVAGSMEPLNVRTARSGFEILNEALWNWYRDREPAHSPLTMLEHEGLDTDYARLLRSNYDVTLVSFGDRSWTIRDFLGQFTPGRYVIRARDPLEFKARLSDVIALVVRDRVFLDQAEAERLDENPTFQRTFALWKDKWMFQEYRNLLAGRRPGGLTRSDIERFTDSLFALYDVEVNETVRDTISLSVSERNPTMTVHLFKNNANKMPFPILDGAWKPASGSQP